MGYTTTAQKFMNFLDVKGVHYTSDVLSESGNSRVIIKYSGDHANTIPVTIIFYTSGESVAVKSYTICKVPQDKVPLFYKLANGLNAEYRWIKFYIDSDIELMAETDAVIDEYSAANVTYELVNKIVSIVDDVYPNVMKELWA